MNVRMIAEIAYNFSLLLALCLLFILFPYNTQKSNIYKKISTGLIIGIIGMVIMFNPFTLIEGVVFDVRSILLLVSGMFFGLIPTVIGGSTLIIYRIIEGGAGTVPGITVIICSVIIGVLWRHYRFNKVIARKSYRWKEYYLIGIVTHMAMLLSMFTLPWDTAVFILRNISLPVLVIYPIGTLLISIFLSFQVDMYDFNNRLSESENRHRAIFENAPVGICNTALDGSVLNANQHFQDIIGYDLDELKSMKFSDYTHPDDIERSRRYLIALQQDKEATVFDEKKYIHKNGSLVNVLFSSVMLWKSNDEPLYTVTTIRDITKMTQLENNYSILIQSIMNGLCILDEKGDFIEANEQFCKLTGYTSEEIGVMNIGDIAILNNQSKIIKKLQGVSEIGKERFIDTYRHRDGTDLSVEVNLVPMPDSKSKFYMLVRDLTKEIKLEKEKLHMEAYLRNQQKLESVGTLASGVAHEINNPINGIMNYAQIILDNHSDDEETAGYAKEIIDETDRVAVIVKNLLQFSRQTEQNYIPVDIKEIAEETMSLIKSTILKENIDVIFDIDDNLPKILCRKQEIRQVLMNLVTNARDAVVQTDGVKRIIISSDVVESNEGRFLRLVVGDNGPGVPNQIVDKIFDPFFTTKPRDRGTGLGLSISYGIIKEHGGQLRLNSIEGQGAEFIIELPCE